MDSDQLVSTWFSIASLLYGPRREKTCLWGFVNNTGADQPRILISAFVIRLLESIISILDTSEFSIIYLVSVAEETVCVSLCRIPRRRVLSLRGPSGSSTIWAYMGESSKFPKSKTFETPIFKFAVCPLNIYNFKFKWSIVFRQTVYK